MASHSGRRGERVRGPRVKSFGTFTLHGAEGRTFLTISQRLAHEEFPNKVGEEVEVQLVQPDEGPEYLEVIPVDGDGGG